MVCAYYLSSQSEW
nr:Retrovirus Pol polyprotein [Hymenolepis microstoma]